MKTEYRILPASRAVAKRQFVAGAATFLATLMALPVNAGITIPDEPMTTGTRIPANILFVLDNSGSMTWDYMPDSVPGVTGIAATKAYTRNTIYYNPFKTYRPWVNPDGSEMTGGMSYDAVYSDVARVPPFATATVDLRGSIQTFYVPKDPADPNTFGSAENYWRYEIHLDGRIVRSEYGPRIGASSPYNRGLDNYGCSTAGGNGWRNCTYATSVSGRTEDAEKSNFAVWYSYHRTRYKVAKSGAGRAFSQIGTNYRVGYRNIWNNMSEANTAIPGGGVWPAGGKWNSHPIKNAKPIPVTRNEGLFDDPSGTTGANNNRTSWFQRLYSENYSGNTPLRFALWNAGNYYATDHANDGPWGPGLPSEQFTCRLSYTILTTDGYRNDSNSPGYDYTGQGKMVGDQDGGFPLPYSGGNQADTLADIAMYFWKTDLRPDMEDNVPASIDDPAKHQHMATFTVSLGAAGALNPETDLPAIMAGTKVWPISVNNTASSVDDLWHAAINGHGKYVLATDPDKFTKALQDALAEIEKRTSSYSNVTSSSVSLDTSTLAFNASYEQGTWAGGLVARKADDLSVVKWTASIGSWASRNILTSEAGTGEIFPTTNQKAALARTGGTFNYPVSGQQNADYIKGDTSKEGDDAPALRKRSGLLGDIINSSPAYVKETDTLYVGANDGMLHAFDAANGQELFSYIPGIINWGLLSTLSRGDYAHKYFVDGPISVSERKLRSDNKNILVGSLGRGGKGLFALDVTSPGTATKSIFKWERADTDNKNMGLVFGKPLLVKVRSGSGTPAVVVGNGPNSTNDRAVLIVMNLDDGQVIKEIDTGAGSALEPNGLFAPTGVYGPDGKTVAYVYAGDMLGNVWKFDLSSPVPSGWSAKKIFSATDSGGKSQPITSGVTVAVHPITSKRWVFFGTGRYLVVDDANGSNTDVQSMYGFMEDDTATLDRSQLVSRAIITTGTSNGYEVRGFQSKAALPPTAKGWYIDLPANGERIVQNAQVVSTYMLTASMKPSGDACSANGSGYINAVDAFTGTSAGGSYFDLDGNPNNNDQINGVPVGSVNVGGGMPTLPNLLRGMLLTGGSAGSEVKKLDTLRPKWDRVAWREIRND